MASFVAAAAATRTTPSSSSSRTLLLFWTSLALVLSFASTGEAIKCYQCASATNRNCGDPFVDEGVTSVECSTDSVHQAVNQVKGALSDILGKFGVDIPQGASSSMIDFICQKIKHSDKDGNEVVIRTCALSPDTANSCPPESAGTLCLQCRGDLCNAAPVVAPAFVRLLALLLGPLLVATRLLRP